MASPVSRSPSSSGSNPWTIRDLARLPTVSFARAAVRSRTTSRTRTPVTLSDNMSFVPIESEDDWNLLATSGLLDEINYGARAGLSGGVDAVAHYLERG